MSTDSSVGTGCVAFSENGESAGCSHRVIFAALARVEPRLIGQAQRLLGVDQVQLDQGNRAMLGQRCLELATLLGIDRRRELATPRRELDRARPTAD